jgi:hypothetical protein
MCTQGSSSPGARPCPERARPLSTDCPSERRHQDFMKEWSET